MCIHSPTAKPTQQGHDKTIVINLRASGARTGNITNIILFAIRDLRLFDISNITRYFRHILLFGSDYNRAEFYID